MTYSNEYEVPYLGRKIWLSITFSGDVSLKEKVGTVFNHEQEIIGELECEDLSYELDDDLSDLRDDYSHIDENILHNSINDYVDRNYYDIVRELYEKGRD